MQKKAIVLFVAGVILCVPWALALLAFSATGDVIVIPTGPGGIVAIVAIVSLPAFVGGVIAFRIPRLIRLRCANCGWQQTAEMCKY